MEAHLGIDFGTTNTRVAVRGPEGDPVALPIGTVDPWIPSVVALKRDASGKPSIYQVGEPAAALSDSDDVVVIENLKRCLTYRIMPFDDANLPSWWDRENRVIRVWGHPLDPLEVAAAIIDTALRAAVRAAGVYGISLNEEQIRELPMTLGCPSYSGYDAHEMMADVMHRLGNQGFGIGDVVEEPNLTSVSFAAWQELGRGEELGRPHTVLIYDLGGGTFDTAIVEVRFVDGQPRLTVLGADCLPFTGGMDIDQALTEEIMDKIAAAMDTPAEMLACLTDQERHSLLRRTRDAKEELTVVPETRLVMENLAGQPLDVPVSRDDLTAALDRAGIVDKTLSCCLRAYRRARMYLGRKDEGGFFMGVDKDGRVGESVLNLRFEDMAMGVDKVILVGGSTAIPELRQRLLDIFGKDKILSGDGYLEPMTAIALGAAFPRERYEPAVLTRAPYWVRLRCGEETTVVYKPFDPYLSYDFRGMVPSERPLSSVVDLSHAQESVIDFCHCNQETASVHETFDTKDAEEAIFGFDRYGTIHLCEARRVPSDGSPRHTCINPDNVLYRDPSPPWQHEYQREMQEALERHKEEEREEERRRLDEQLHRPPWLEND